VATRYLDICDSLTRAVADGELGPGASLASVREVARREATTPTTVARAYAELARAGVIVTAPRRAARVAADGPAMARRRLAGGRALLLAGSDDPLLDVLVADAGETVTPREARGSFGGLTALWRRRAQAATLHLWHDDGDHNAPYAARVLADRRPILVSLWRREQGILVGPGNPQAISTVSDLTRVRVAQRRVGTGTRALVDRLLGEVGVGPGAISGPELDSHLEVALCVAAGAVDAGVGVRAAATAIGLHFVPLGWEPFDLALSGDDLAVATPLLDALARPEIRSQALALGGYDLERAGSVRSLG
jgi:putative molybdopterin biosynthesis protein